MNGGSAVYALRRLLDDLPSYGLFVDILKKKLLIVSDMLADAEQNQLADPEVEQWLNELLRVLFCLLENPHEQTATEALRRRLKPESQINKTRVCSFISTAPIFIDKSTRRKLYLRLTTECYEDEQQIFSRNEDRKAIIKLLLSDDITGDDQIDVIAIVGEGGVGKSTLAQLVYRDVRVKKNFELEAWVCVAGKFYVLQLTRSVFEALTCYPPDIENLCTLMVILKERLKMKKFLLVLDDDWCRDYYSFWRTLGVPLLAGANGSKIIITTRNSTVAATMGPVPVSEAFKANLKSKKDLDVLKLEYSDNSVSPQNESWNRLTPQLVQLQLIRSRYYSFSNVVFSHLRNVNCSYLPPLGRLPYLKYLSLQKMNRVKRVDSEFYGTINSSVKPFPSLVTLVFRGLLEWQEWIFPKAGGVEFPRLQNLRIQRCPKLKMGLPECFPPSTKTVEISECPKLLVTFSRLTSKDYSCLNDGHKLLLDTTSKCPDIDQSLQLLDSNVVQRKCEKLVDTPSQQEEESLQLLRSVDDVASQCSENKTDNSITSESLCPESSVLLIEDSSVKYEVPVVRSKTDDPMDTWNYQDISCSLSLKVSEISQLMELPPGLCSLKIKGCDSLKSLPSEQIHNNPYLRHLYIIDCCSFESFQGGHPPIALKTLYIRNCKNLEFPSPAGTICHSLLLEHLCIGSSCESLSSFPLTSFPNLRSFIIWDCANFTSISITKDHLSLDTLEIRDCPKMVSFPKGGLPTPNLTSIILSNCNNLKELPDQLHQLKFLQSLFINECPELISIPDGGFPDNLIVLCITSCPKLTPRIEWGLHKLENLSRFEIEGGCRDLESFPKKRMLPNNLNSLRISRLPNLQILEYKGLQHLTSLETLQINCCSKLGSLPEEGLPSSLTSLYISECSLLKAKLQSKQGIDWYNIAHIPHIQIDEEVIS